MRFLEKPLIVHMDHVSAVLDVDYSPTGKEFVSASFDKSIRIFPVDKGHSRSVMLQINLSWGSSSNTNLNTVINVFDVLLLLRRGRFPPTQGVMVVGRVIACILKNSLIIEMSV